MRLMCDIERVLQITLVCSGLISGSPCYLEFTAQDIPLEITSPGYPVKYPSNISCPWRIKSQNAGKTVVVETVDFFLHVTDQCQGDHLLVFDDTSVSGRNWKLCGEDRQMIISTGPSLYLILKSDTRYETRGFRLRYHQSLAGGPCNRDLVASEVRNMVFSPGYPVGYFSNLECHYTIRTEIPEDRIEINVVDSEIEDANHCQYDWLKIVNVDNGIEQVLGTICGTETSTYQSSGNTLQIQFVSNTVKVNKGFKIQYRSIDRKDCSGVRLAATRTDSHLLSPEYPNHYSSNLTCDWTIYSPDDKRTIDLSVITSNLSGSYPNCTEDKVKVSGMAPSDQRAVFCGTKTSRFQVKNSVHVFLYTASDTEGKGLKISYQLKKENMTIPTCGGTMHVKNSSQIMLQSPLYPHAPLMDHRCEWTLNTTQEGSIVLFLIDLDVEMSRNCQFDSLTIYDASSVTDDKTLETWCGQRGGEVVYSTGQYLTIVYRVDDSNNGRGFSLTYSRQKGKTKTTFRMIAKDTVSYLTSPGLFHYIPRNKSFSYIFVTDVGYQIKLEVKHSSLPAANSSCIGVTKGTVYSGQTDTSPRLASINTQQSTWCGLDMPAYISSDNHMLLVYHIELQGNKSEGFQVTYIQGNFTGLNIDVLEPKCGGQLVANSDYRNITSVYYPRLLSYELNCRWVIRTSSNGSVIRLVGLDVVIGMLFNGTCKFGSVTFFEGSELGSNMIDQWCGRMSKTIQTTGKALTIVLRSNGNVVRSAFNMHYAETTQSPPCELSLSVTDLLYHTTYLGHSTELNQTCSWLFFRKKRSHYQNIELTLKNLPNGVINNDTCSDYYIDIYDGASETSQKIGVFCGGEEKSYIGTGDQMFVKVVASPASGTIAGGFDIDFLTVPRTVCGDGDLRAHNSCRALTSPFYPYQYPRNIDCIWSIGSGGPDYITVIEVVIMDIVYSEGCEKDYLEVDNGESISPSVKRWCGNKTSTYQSKGEFLTIRFHTSSAVSKTGFRLQYWRENRHFTNVSDVQSLPSDRAPLIGVGAAGMVLVIIIVGIVYMRNKRSSKANLPTVNRKKTNSDPGADEGTLSIAESESKHVETTETCPCSGDVNLYNYMPRPNVIRTSRGNISDEMSSDSDTIDDTYL